MKAGDFVDKYQLLKTLGHGGMGGVWIAFDPDTNDLVAVKTLFEEFANDELYVRRFKREVDLLKRLRHPHIVGYRGGGQTDRTYYLALEYIRGPDLADQIKDRGRHSVSDALPIIVGVTRALAYAHSQGVIHRDIKPSNIMVSSEGKIPKILDFGVAHAQDPNLMTATGDVVGTFLYASPEQNQGREVDERSDIYALGLTFHELLTGIRVLKGTNHQEVTAMQLMKVFPLASELNPAVPQELDRILEKMLATEADKRYQDCDELLMDLESFQNDPEQFAADRRSIYEYPQLVPLFKEAQKAYKKGRLDEAIEAVGHLIAEAPRAAEVHLLMGQAQRKKGLPFNAVNAFKRAINFQRGDIGHQMELAATYEEMGMEGAALETYEAILVIEPNATKARRRIEAIQGTSTEESEEPSKPKDPMRVSQNALQPARISSKMLAVDGAEEEETEALSPEEIKARQTRLKKALPPRLDRNQTVVLGILVWGFGLYRLGQKRAALAAMVIELILIGGGLYFAAHPRWVPPEFFGQAAMQWAANNAGESARWAKIACALLWGAGSFWIALEIYAGVAVLNRQAYVIEVDPQEKTALLNEGASRGFVKGDRLLIYQGVPHSGGAGQLIGEIKLVEVLQNESAGRFFSSGDTRAAPGDFAVTQTAVHEGWIDPTRPSATRFPELD